MAQHATDYLIIGAGATGLAFADTLLHESDAHITLVDMHGQPGGHWNDAYPFVSLHQPSAFYGVNSLALGTHRKDTVGHNAGMYELASGAEVSGYFHQVMHQKLLPSGRVRYLPMSRFDSLEAGTARVTSLLSGAASTMTVRRKLVDARHFSPSVPATTPPKFSVAGGVRLVTPTQLTQLWQSAAERPARFCILGAGKTAMDAAVWLLECGVAQEAISWVMPRDSWVVNRLTTQPGEEFFKHSIGGQLAQMKALAEASSVADLFERLEASGQMLRIDTQHTPRMFHYATLSEGEVQLLRQIQHVIRKGRVLAIERDALVLEQGREAMNEHTLYINCTASAVEPRDIEPIFQPGKIVPQLVRAPLVTFSSAVCAYVEAHVDDDAAKNALCTPVPFPRNVGGYVQSTLVSLANQMRWSQDKPLRNWMRESRLDGFGKMMAGIDPADTEKTAIVAELRQQAMAAVGNVKRLMAGSAG
jgi:hypothetical protein